MNNLNKFLIGALTVQVILAIVIYRPKNEEEAASGPLLVDFDPTAVNQIKITDDEGSEVTIIKTPEGNWVLPEMDAFPVNGTTVTSLLDQMGKVQTNRLITRSETSHRRLKVSPDEFLRQVELTGSDGKTRKFYLGTTGGGNATHARVDGDNNVYLVSNLTIQDATTQVSSWINTAYVSVNADDITSLKLENANGVFEFTKAGDQWTLVGMEEGGIFNDSAFQSMFNQVSTLRMIKPLGKEVKSEYGLDAPQATLTITVREVVPTPEPTAEATEAATPEATATPAEPQYTEKTYIVQFGAEYESEIPAKSSESEYYVLVAEGTARTFIDKTHDSFVTLPTATPTPTLEPTPEATPSEASN